MIRQRWILIAWAAAVALLTPFAARTSRTLDVAAASENSDAARVEELLTTRFGSQFAAYAVLVVRGVSVSDSSGFEALSEIADAVAAAPGVTRVLSYVEFPDSMFVSPSGTFLVVGLRPDPPPRDAIVGLRALTAELSSRLRARLPALDIAWTGAAAIDHDVRLVSAADAAAAERRVLPVTLILLIAVFGSVVAAILPIAAGVLSNILALGGATVIAERWPLTILLQNVVSMIGLGLGIDYALLMVSRFRLCLAGGLSADDAAAETRRTAGHTVLVSGTAVSIGFAALLVIPAAELRSIAIGGLLVTVASVLLATTLLPTLLALLGHRVDRWRIRPPERRQSGIERWRRWGLVVTKRPLVALACAGIPLIVLAAQALRINAAIPSGTWLPERTESARGAIALRDMGHSGLIQTIRIVAELPANAHGLTQSGWRAVLALSRALARDGRVAHVRSLPLTVGTDLPAQESLDLVPPEARSALLSRDRRLMLLELEPVESATPAALVNFVRELRALDPDSALGVPGSRLLIGGLPAFNADYEDAVGGSVAMVVGLVVCGTLVALFLGFRSVLVPIKAVALNLLSVAAAIGATVVVFQDGFGARLLGLSAPVDGLFPAVPIIVFCIVFGLSMDYEVFLVDRVREGIRRGMSDNDALVEGLAHTGGVITSAALVMIVVFAGFAAGDFLIIKILGFALSVAVLIDATLVRMAVGPALLQLAGRWNWWPSLHEGEQVP